MNGARPNYRPRSLFGPLLIAAIGVCFLLINFGAISGRNLGWWFARYWPLLLIFWGVVKFVEYQWARRNNQAYPGVGAGGVVFVILLVLFGMGATASTRINWRGVNLDSDDDWSFGFFGNRYDFTENFAQPMPTATQVKLLADRGDLTITASADDQAHVVVHKFVRSHTQQEADQFNNSTHPKFEQQGGVWLLDLTGGNFSEGRFDLVLQLPPKYPLSVMARRGDLQVSQLEADIELEVNHGDITLDQIKGNALLRPHRNDIRVKNVSGNVTVDGDVDDSTISDIAGSLTFTTGFSGDLDLSRIAGPVHFRSSRTDLQFGKLAGDLNMDSSDLRANAITGPFTLSTTTKDVHLDDVSGSIHIDDHRGDIEIQAKAPLGNVDIATTGGEINIGLPATPGFQVDAESDSGEIQSPDYSLSINNQSNNATATGTVGKGGPQVRLKTIRGTIQIHKSG